MSIESAGDTSIEVGFTPISRINPYDLWATSTKIGKYSSRCDRNRGRCQINNMRPGVNYTLTLTSCYGSHPIHCMVQAKQRTFYTKPQCTLNIRLVRKVEFTFPNLYRIYCSSCASQCSSECAWITDCTIHSWT